MNLMDRVSDVEARRHLSPLTVECYQRWIYQFLEYWAKRSGGSVSPPLCGGEPRQSRGLMDGNGQF
jgi:hypothetical protein